MYFASLLAVALLAPAMTVQASVINGSAVNPFTGKDFYANSGYADKLEATIKVFEASGDETNVARTKVVQQTGTFIWVSDFPDVDKLKTQIQRASSLQKKTKKKQIVGVVVYNIPDRDCSASAAAGKLSFAQGGEQEYKRFVDSIAAEIKQGQDLTYAIVLEPDSLANLVTNMKVDKCAKAAEGYKKGIAYAIEKLQFCNAALYIDAGHGGWLGWDTNLEPAAKLFAEVLKLAKGGKVRGLATNVSNYNAYKATVPEKFTSGDNSWDESHYVNNLAPLLKKYDFPQHFIIDVGRNGQLDIRSSWSEFCNIKGAGFGQRPTTDTQDALVDALVWVKPGGESDGSSNSTSPRFDKSCTGPTSKLGAPEGGEWFNEYVVDLVKNANPPLPTSLYH